MRTETIQADGWTVTVRGRTRRTTALESEYLVGLKQGHQDMKAASPNGNTEELLARDPRAWSLLGTANTFRYLIARCAEIVTPGGETFQEPFKPDQLVEVFDHYLDAEELPDKSDLWSQVQTAIERMDNPEPVAAPNAEGSASTK